MAGSDGLLDIDLSITPSTNTLPIRRLDLAVGGRKSVEALWIRFPDLQIDQLSQTYQRSGPGAYRYESNGGAFAAELEVDSEGVVVTYGDLWERVSST